jgi:hypothetical protein
MQKWGGRPETTDACLHVVQTMARIILEQKGVLDERALILTILKLLSQQDYSKAEEKMQDLARLSPMAGILTLLSQRSYRNPSQSHRGRQDTAALLEWRAPAAADGDGDGKGGKQEAVDPDIYTQEGGRYKYGIQVRDSEEIRVVKGIMLKILLQLDEQEANLQKQQDLWNEVCDSPRPPLFPPAAPVPPPPKLPMHVLEALGDFVSTCASMSEQCFQGLSMREAWKD